MPKCAKEPLQIFIYLSYGVIERHALNSINHKWFTDFVTLCNDGPNNVAYLWQNLDVLTKNAIIKYF